LTLGRRRSTLGRVTHREGGEHSGQSYPTLLDNVVNTAPRTATLKACSVLYTRRRKEEGVYTT